MKIYKLIIILLSIIALAEGTVVRTGSSGTTLFSAIDINWLPATLPVIVFIMILLLFLNNIYTEIGLPIVITFILNKISNQIIPKAKEFFMSEFIEMGTAIYYVKILFILYLIIIYIKRHKLIILLPIIYLIATNSFIPQVIQIIQEIPNLFSETLQSTEEYISKLIESIITIGSFLVAGLIIFNNGPITAEEQKEIDEIRAFRAKKRKLSELGLQEHQMIKRKVDYNDPLYKRIRDDIKKIEEDLW